MISYKLALLENQRWKGFNCLENHLLCINNFVYWFDICCLFAFAKFHLSEIHLLLRVLCQKSDSEVCLSVWQTSVNNWPEPLNVTGRLLLKYWSRASRWRTEPGVLSSSSHPWEGRLPPTNSAACGHTQREWMKHEVLASGSETDSVDLIRGRRCPHLY